MLSKAFDLAPEHKHTIVTAGHENDVFLELDQYPAAATFRRAAPGRLAPGVAIATFSHPDLDSVAALWLAPPERRQGAIYGGRRTGILHAPDGVLVELVSLA